MDYKVIDYYSIKLTDVEFLLIYTVVVNIDKYKDCIGVDQWVKNFIKLLIPGQIVDLNPLGSN